MKTKTINKEKKKPLRRKLILILILMGLLSYFIYTENTTVDVSHYEIISGEIPDGFDKYRIVQLSDLHDAKLGENHSKVVNEVKEISPQAVFITGDFVDSNRYDLEQSLVLIKELQFVAPIYFVTGNHEIATQDMDNINEALKKMGVRVLSDEADVIKILPDSSIAIGGIEDPLTSNLGDNQAIKTSIETAFKQVPDNMFKILLSHRPEQFNVYDEQEIDVTFSGHAHGGQFRIPGIGGLVSPGQGWFPKYTSGVHEKNGSHLVVSRGLGNSIIPVRLFNRPEIVVVTLRKVE